MSKIVHTMSGKIEQLWQFLRGAASMPRVRETTSFSAKLVEERVDHRIDGRETLSRSIFKQQRDQIDGIWCGLAEDLTDEN